MKVFIPVSLMYFILGYSIAYVYSNNAVIGFGSLILYVLFSVTYFKQTFIPYVLNWFGSVINDNSLMESMKNDETMKPYMGLIGGFYLAMQNKDEKIHKVIKTVSYLAFLIFPILIYFHYKIYIQMKSVNK